MRAHEAEGLFEDQLSGRLNWEDKVERVLQWDEGKEKS